jgi:hypothetical protein
LKPGDRVLLEKGAEFQGPLVLDENDQGMPGKPIQLLGYGTRSARPRIVVKKGDGIVIRDSRFLALQGIEVSGLDCTRGVPSSCADYGTCGRSEGAGIAIIASGAHAPPQDIVIRDSKVVGFALSVNSSDGSKKNDYHGNGIAVWSADDRHGVSSLLIENTELVGNGFAGFLSDSPNHQSKVHGEFLLRNVYAHDNSGTQGLRTHSGSGILLACTQDALVTESEGSHNGCLSQSSQGPVGIWAYSSDHVVIEKSRAIGNRTAGTADGGGFDLDGGVTRSVMRDNYSEDNDGAGYLLAEYPWADPFHTNEVSGNVSVNDGRKNNVGGIAVWGEINDTLVTKNKVYVKATVAPYTVAGIRLLDWTGKGLRFEGNDFYLNEVPAVDLALWESPKALLPEIESNRFYACGSQQSLFIGNGLQPEDERKLAAMLQSQLISVANPDFCGRTSPGEAK